MQKELGLGIKKRMPFDRIKMVLPSFNVPPIVSFSELKQRVLIVNINIPKFNIDNEPINLDYLINHSAFVVSNKREFKHWNFLKDTSVFTFIYNIESGSFMISDTKTGAGHAPLTNAFYMLMNESITECRHNYMSGAFKINENGEITSPLARLLYSKSKGTKKEKRNIDLFHEMALGLKRLGCSERISFILPARYPSRSIVTK
jgi:hypothetical protein